MTKRYKYRIPVWLIELAVAAALAFGIIVTVRVLVAHGEERATFTDRNGHFAGSSITHGPKTDFFDARGRYQGTTTQQGTPSNPLGNVNGSDPFGRRGR